jgi:predicted TIM-barrel fold metal-dependent hydrolase
VARAAELMRRENVVGGVDLSGGPSGEGLEEKLAEAGRVPDLQIRVFTNLDWSGFGAPGWTEREVARLERAKAAGAAGLKIFKSLGLTIPDPATGKLLRVDDARLAPIFEAAGRLGLPVAIHTGDPKAFFRPDGPDNERHAELALHPNWSFARPGYPSWEELFGEFEAVVAAHPHTTFIGVHFGNDPEEPFRVGQLLDRCPNLYVDVAARVGELGRQDPAKLRALFLAHRDRILFGTDWAISADAMTLGAGNGHPETLEDLDRFFARHAEFFETAHRHIAHPVPVQGAWTVDGIDLPDDALQALYVGNAERLLHLAPR